MQRVIILRGVMASGKSTIAKRFRSFNTKTAWLKVDNFKDFFSPNSTSETLSFVHSAAIVTLKYLLQEGFSVVMEGVFQNPDYISVAVQTAKELQVPVRVFQLKVSLEILQARDRTREGVKEGCREILGDAEIARVFQVFEEHTASEAIVLDTEKMSIEECIIFIDKLFDGYEF